jgi:hypothetical protein
MGVGRGSPLLPSRNITHPKTPHSKMTQRLYSFVCSARRPRDKAPRYLVRLDSHPKPNSPSCIVIHVERPWLSVCHSAVSAFGHQDPVYHVPPLIPLLLGGNGPLATASTQYSISDARKQLVVFPRQKLGYRKGRQRVAQVENIPRVVGV